MQKLVGGGYDEREKETRHYLNISEERENIMRDKNRTRQKLKSV